jgi:hypothetical protein
MRISVLKARHSLKLSATFSLSWRWPLNTGLIVFKYNPFWIYPKRYALFPPVYGENKLDKSKTFLKAFNTWSQDICIMTSFLVVIAT